MNLSKREKLQISRERAKLEKQLGSISDLNRLPSAIFVVDILKEKISIAEARKLNIPTFAMVDTNSDPTLIDFPVPSNDDASKSIQLIVKVMVDAIEEGLAERKVEKDNKDQEDIDEAAAKEMDSKVVEEYGDLEDQEAEKLVKKGEKIPLKTSEGEKKEAGKRPRKPIGKSKK